MPPEIVTPAQRNVRMERATTHAHAQKTENRTDTVTPFQAALLFSVVSQVSVPAVFAATLIETFILPEHGCAAVQGQ